MTKLFKLLTPAAVLIIASYTGAARAQIILPETGLYQVLPATQKVQYVYVNFDGRISEIMAGEGQWVRDAKFGRFLKLERDDWDAPSLAYFDSSNRRQTVNVKKVTSSDKDIQAQFYFLVGISEGLQEYCLAHWEVCTPQILDVGSFGFLYVDSASEAENNERVERAKKLLILVGDIVSARKNSRPYHRPVLEF